MFPGTPDTPMPNHPTVFVKWVDSEAQVDVLLAPLILALWKKGIRTHASCQDEDRKGTVWIRFPSGIDALAFVKFVGPMIANMAWSADMCWPAEEDRKEYMEDDKIGIVSIKFHSSWLKDLQLDETKPFQD